MLNQNNFKIQFIKIYNFKSYKKLSLFDTFETTGWITGKNGTGKTNLIEAFMFVCGEVLKNINCSSFEYLFPDLSIRKNFVISRVDLIIKYKCIFIKISRTIDIDGINEFYLNDKSVSFFHFKILFDWIGLRNIRELVFLNNLENNFIFLNKDCLLKLFYDLVDFKKKSKLWEKIKVLKNKLQTNDYFYSRKIKFIINQKFFFYKKKRMIDRFRIIKVDLKIEKKKFFFDKKKIFLHENLKLLKTNAQKLLQLEYLSFYSFSTTAYRTKCKYLKKKNDRLKKSSMADKYHFLLTNFFFINKNIKKLKTFFSLIKKKYALQCFFKVFWDIYFQDNTIYKGKLCVILHTKFDFFFLYVKKFFFKTLSVYNVKFNEMLKNFKTYHTCSTKYDLPSFVHFYVFLRFKDINMFIDLSYEKIIFNLFFYNVYFIFMIKFFIKNPDKRKIRTIRNLYQIIPSFLLKTIRGLYIDLFKILDCSYKSILKKFIKKKSNTIFINNPTMITSLIKYIKKIHTRPVKILVKKHLINLHEIKQKKNTYIFVEYLEFEGSDLACFFYADKKNLLDIEKKLSKKEKKLQIPGYYILKNSIYPIVSFFPASLKKKSIFNKKKIFLLKERIKQIVSNKITFALKQKNNNSTNNHLFCFFIIGLFKLFEKYFNKIFFFTILKYFLCDYESIIFFLVCGLFESFFFTLKKILFELKKKKILFKKNVFFLNNICIFIHETKKKITNKRTFNFKFYKKYISIVNLFNVNHLNVINKEKYAEFFFTNFINDLIRRNKHLADSRRFMNASDLFLNKLYKIIDLKRKILSYIHGENFKLTNVRIFFRVSTYKLLQYTKIVHLIRNFIFNTKIDCKKHLYISVKKNHIYQKNQFLIQNFFNLNVNLKEKILQKNLFFLKKQIEDNHNRFLYIRSKLLENKYRYLLLNKKMNKSQEKLFKKLEWNFQLVSTKVNHIYKRITKTKSNPLGGTAFLKFSDGKNNKPKISYTAIPSTRRMYNIGALSGGEKIVASFCLIMALHRIYDPPIIFCDELDENLDDIHFKKILKYLVNNSKKKEIKTYMVSLKLKFAKLFECISFILKNQKGSIFYKIFL
nr:structural maintenance of chromosomes 1 [Cryptomonas paramecium]